MKAIWNGKILAESNSTIVVENNHYFPDDSLNKDFFFLTNHHTSCPWKGQASYYNIEVDGKTNENGAWFYPSPNDAAMNIKNYVAFWQGVEVKE
ncbi:DUF427 domain-containing protein [Kaistella sp. 97-N-M2]|uniref:DUF427 domain-containing protein n=1 Tax=Kaistella sp. 97-N-M2 TaxID=2908645 RepID=UPI001F3D7314|nr:DUF427 domain-containing protein [Kaistella sp. 97-N-M2]UJF28716.1 DUF427 domain-containing protein [Kaistella sp. 97-N-M2]